MELLLELLIGLCCEVGGEVLLQVAFELGLSGVKEATGRQNRDPVLATIGYLVLGAAVGGLTLLVAPERLVPLPAIPPRPGLSLVLAPLGVGAAMHAWGSFRRRRGHSPTNLATFWGGAAFAFAAALVRFLAVGR
jgi:hypothetical protein